MVHLRFLGGAVLERNGLPVTGRAAQRHHLALLALLAASPGQNVSRDKLIAYLWPERATRRARHRLSVALHVLRRAIGDDCIVSSGDALTLNPHVVATDVGAFREAFLAGRLEEAVDRYPGPFLDGFFVGGAPGFEQWVERERKRLADLYRAALEGLITEAEARGDAPAAVGWRRRLSRHAPHSASVAVGLIRALATAGDVTGALLHARSHMAHVRSELDVAPDPQVLELVEELQRVAGGRSEEAPERPGGRRAAVGIAERSERASPGAARPPPETGRRPSRRGALLVAVVIPLTVVAAVWGLRADASAGDTGGGVAVSVYAFVEAGGGAAPALGDALAERVAATLAFVPDLRVRVERGASSAGSTVGGGAAEAVVEGALRRGGDRWRVSVRLLDEAGGSTRWTGTWDRPAGDEPALLDELSLTIADSLRLRIAPYEPKVYTESDRAYDRFLQGVHVHRNVTERDVWAALQFYREAWEEDPDFALAHAIAGNAYIALTTLGVSPEIGYAEARKHVEEALALDSTLAEGHAALGRLQLWTELDFEAGERSLRRAIMLYPTLPQARSWYAWYALEVRGWDDVAIANIRRALELDPLNTARSHDVEWVLYKARRYEEVAEQNRVTWMLDPEVARGFADSPLGHAYRELGLYEEAVAEFRAVAERTDGPAPAGLALTYARMGREAEARAILRELESAAGGVADRPLEIARIHASLGDMDAAFRWLDRAFEHRPGALVEIRADPALDPIREDPRYGELLRRIGLPIAGGSG